MDPDRSVRQQGFEHAEYRQCLGSEPWTRAWSPYHASKRWGKSYEFVRFTGPSAHHNLNLLERIEELRASRVDLAFDYFDVDWDAFQLADLLGANVREDVSQDRYESKRGRRVGRTWTVGARGGTQVRIYAKGVQMVTQEKMREHHMHCPAARWQRIEIQMTGLHAEIFWDEWRRDRGTAAGMARQRIYELIPGLEIGDRVKWPDAAPADSEIMRRFRRFVEQNASMIGVAQETGMPLFEMAEEVRKGMCRESKWRHERRVEQMREALRDQSID